MCGRFEQKCSNQVSVHCNFPSYIHVFTGLALIFVTQEYALKVNGDAPKGVSDNCYLEFKHSVKKLTPERMICVVMEEGMRNDSNWDGM